MFKRLFRRRNAETDEHSKIEPRHLHMPEVDELPNIEELFEKAALETSSLRSSTTATGPGYNA